MESNGSDYKARFDAFVKSKDNSAWIDKAIARHKADLKKGVFLWQPEKGYKVCQFLESLVQTKGEFAGKTLKLEPWQVFLVVSIYGWWTEDGRRRFTHVLLSVARKNGKTTVLSGIGLFELIMEAGAEIYIAAQDRGQAGILFTDCANFIKRTSFLSEILDAHTGFNTQRINYRESSGFVKPLHAESDRLDGLNPSCVIYDEFYASKNSRLYDVLESAIGARKNPLIVLTGSHTDLIHGFGFQKESELKDVLMSHKDADDWLVMLFEPDKEDNLDDERTWYKSNPNLGVSIQLETFRSQYKNARDSVSAWKNFKEKNLNVWVHQTVEAWISEDVLLDRFQELDFEDYRGRECVMAFDLSAKNDLTALAVAFPGSPSAVFFRFWIPEDTLNERMLKENPNYGEWVDAGMVKTIPGGRIDDDAVYQEIETLCAEYEIKPIVIRYDRWKAQDLVKKLEAAGYNYEDFMQFPRHFGPAILATEEALYKKSLVLENNPLARMCLYYAQIKLDSVKNPMLVKPNVGAFRKRIDGAVVLVMAYGTLSGMLDAEGNIAEDGGVFASGNFVF